MKEKVLQKGFFLRKCDLVEKNKIKNKRNLLWKQMKR
jgi:hypothetical protein